MSTNAIVRGKTLPDLAYKDDFHDLIDDSSVTISDIVNADIAAAAAIAGTKISPDFGSQDVTTTGTVNAGDVDTDTVLLNETTAPSTGASEGALYTKDTDGQPELFYREESDGDEVQITKDGRVNSLPGEYDTDDSNQVGGSTTTLADDTVYQAAVNGWVIGYAQAGANGPVYYEAKSDSNSSPSTVLQKGGVVSGGDTGYDTNAFCFFVKKNNYWEIAITGTMTGTIYFLPYE